MFLDCVGLETGSREIGETFSTILYVAEIFEGFGPRWCSKARWWDVATSQRWHSYRARLSFTRYFTLDEMGLDEPRARTGQGGDEETTSALSYAGERKGRAVGTLPIGRRALKASPSATSTTRRTTRMVAMFPRYIGASLENLR